MADPRGTFASRSGASTPQLAIEFPITSNLIESQIPSNVSSSDFGGNVQEFCRRFVGQNLLAELDQNGELVYLERGLGFPVSYIQELMRGIQNPLKGFTVRTISAERDVNQENYIRDFGYESNGRNFTASIDLIIRDLTFDQTWVEVDLLNALNPIMGSDAQFTRIKTKFNSQLQQTEIFLEETGKPQVALSDSGSGLKTIFMVLTELLIIPNIIERSTAAMLYVFEELENNLHPGLQRRLYAFIRDFAREHGCRVVLATHSSTALDKFSNDPSAQIIHVTHKDATSTATTITSFADSNTLLDDLGTRASDIFQSNGLIWVEGPSDRIYLNKMIQLIGDGQYLEGSDYGFVFYGGKVLSHFSASANDEELINILRINRNAFLLMDRDTSTLSATKRRITDELLSFGVPHMVTTRKEIECDLPLATYSRIYPGFEQSAPMELEAISAYLDRCCPKELRENRSKTDFAHLVADAITVDDIIGEPASQNLASAVCDSISSWAMSG
jgi:hypothetical protein